MQRGKMGGEVAGLVLALLLAGWACTDVDVFETPGLGKGQLDNKLKAKGEFCTEHPDELNFPVKIMFIIDCSQSMNVTDPPPSPNEYPGRVRAVLEVIDKFRYDPGVEFAILRFEAAANVSTQRDTNGDGVPDMFGFVNDLPTLLRAVNSLVAAGGNTSYQAALALAEATLAMDMSNSSVDERARTKYVIIFLSDGLPYPVDYDDQVNTPFSIRRAVEEMMHLADRFEVSEMKLHTAFLAVDTPEYINQQAEQLLKTNMADVGGGTYRNFQNGEEINFLDIDFTAVKRMYAVKDGAFIVSNSNAHTAWSRSDSVDTDGDGLVDEVELELGTDLGRIDSDADGFNDLLEHSLRRSGFDALDPDDADCNLALDRLDRDGDGLLDCEERFLGTSPDLFDTDADGVPDPVEVRIGTNPVWADADVDMDFDGSLNADEAAWHTDPSTNDAAQFSKLAYRYRFGRIPGYFESRMCYEFEVDNITLVGTRPRQAGEPEGYNDIMVYTGQVPHDDPDDYGTFRVACARVRYIPRYPENDIKYPPNGLVRFQQKHFKRPVATRCSSDEQCPHHVCDPRTNTCLAPLGDLCDEATPCPNFACELDPVSGASWCAAPVATSCLADTDCPPYPVDPASGVCRDPLHSPPDPVTGQCPRRECEPQYFTCSATGSCESDGDANPDNDPQCLAGFCRVPCLDAGDCNPGETCDSDGPDEWADCLLDADCPVAGQGCVDGSCRTPCGIDADCGAREVCEASWCSGHHCVDHHGGTCIRLACTSDAECPQQPCDPEVGRCRQQACLDSRECPYQECELVVGFCMGTTCAEDTDCRGERGYTCNSVIGDPCVWDIDCPFDFCTATVRNCALGGQGCTINEDCPSNACQGQVDPVTGLITNGRCQQSNSDCTSNLDCSPNMCLESRVCANDPTVACTISLDCPQTFCGADGRCINNPAQGCDPTTENLDNACQVGMCSREGGLGTCDTLEQETCQADAECPPYRCNPSTGFCDVANQNVCNATTPCPAGLQCMDLNAGGWGTCKRACTGDDDCPRAHCEGRCLPLDPDKRQRCTDWFDADRDCLRYDESNAGTLP